MKSHHKYFEKQLRGLPIEKLWEIVDELLLPYPSVFDKTMNYEQVLVLCIILKENDEMSRNLEQITILASALGDIYNHKS
ncbi:MAG: hypothetical protein WA833_08650 [Nitrosotalea sp.]